MSATFMCVVYFQDLVCNVYVKRVVCTASQVWSVCKYVQSGMQVRVVCMKVRVVFMHMCGVYVKIMCGVYV